MSPDEQRKHVAEATEQLTNVQTEHALRVWRDRWLDGDAYQMALERDHVDELDRMYDQKLAQVWGI